MPKRCQEIMQIKIYNVKPTNYEDFRHRKYEKYVKKHYSYSVRVDVLLDQAVLLPSLSNSFIIGHTCTL